MRAPEGPGEEAAPAVRQRLALALDRPTLADAEELLRRLGRWFGVGKVGLELFVAAGPAAWAAVAAAGLGVFADLKLHDIPATVQGAARAAARGGADLLTVHLAGGPAMVTAAVAGFGEGAAAREAAGEPVRWRGPRGVLGVTVLTSEAEADPGVLAARAALAVEAGCVGLVCAARDQPVVADVAPTLLRVVPGVRLAGGARQDQARVATPAEAIGGGAGLLVIGRAVTAAENPGAAAAAVAAEVQGALEGPDAPAGEAGAAGA